MLNIQMQYVHLFFSFLIEQTLFAGKAEVIINNQPSIF